MPAPSPKPPDPLVTPDRLMRVCRDEWRFLAVAGGIVVAALLLRLYRLGTQELWLDEVLSFAKATNPAWLGSAALRENTPPLYYLLLRVWVLLAGPSEQALRLLSAVLGTLFVAATIWAGREFFDRTVGVWSGVWAAVNPIHIYYSQEARAYVLLTLTLLLTYVALWRALQLGTARWWGLFSACALLALYSHYLAALGLLPTAFLVLVWPGTWAGTGRWLRYSRALLFSTALFLPWVLGKLALMTARAGTAMGWQQEIWEQTSALLAIPRSLEVFALGSQAGLLPIGLKQYTELEFPVPLRLLGLAGLVAVGIWVAIPVGEARLGVPWLGTRKAWLGLLLFFPLVTLWLASFHKPVYLAGRYDQVAFPSYPLLLGLALAKVQRVGRAGPLIAPVVALVLLIPVGAKLALYYQAPAKRPALVTAELLDARTRNGDVVVLTGSRGIQIHYYLTRLGYRTDNGVCAKEVLDRRFACRLFPRHGEQLFASSDRRGTRSASGGDAIREDLRAYLVELAPTGGVVWVTFERGAFVAAEERFVLPKLEASLVRELSGMGFRPVPVVEILGVFQFRPRS